MALTNEQLRVLAYIEQVFWETGYVPTNEKIANDLAINKTVVNRYYENPDFRAAAIARGVDIDPDKSTRALDPKQVLAANLMMNTLDKKNMREKLKMIGVTPQQFAAWKRQVPFQEYLKKRAEAVFDSSDPDAYLGLAKAVEAGDLNAIKFHFEMRGIYNPRLQIDVNVEHVLVRVVDIVSQHVTPEVLEKIADELEGVMGGQISAPSVTQIKNGKKPLPMGVIDI